MCGWWLQTVLYIFHAHDSCNGSMTHDAAVTHAIMIICYHVFLHRHQQPQGMASCFCLQN